MSYVPKCTLSWVSRNRNLCLEYQKIAIFMWILICADAILRFFSLLTQSWKEMKWVPPWASLYREENTNSKEFGNLARHTACEWPSLNQGCFYNNGPAFRDQVGKPPHAQLSEHQVLLPNLHYCYDFTFVFLLIWLMAPHFNWAWDILIVPAVFDRCVIEANIY